jgi:hypothetical protein
MLRKKFLSTTTHKVSELEFRQLPRVLFGRCELASTIKVQVRFDFVLKDSIAYFNAGYHIWVWYYISLHKLQANGYSQVTTSTLCL